MGDPIYNPDTVSEILKADESPAVVAPSDPDEFLKWLNSEPAGEPSC